jgi:hypothetical protein
MNIYIDLNYANDAHGVVAVDAKAIVTFSPREGFGAEKIGELERDLGPYISKRLNDALKKGGAKWSGIVHGLTQDACRFLQASSFADCAACFGPSSITSHFAGKVARFRFRCFAGVIATAATANAPDFARSLARIASIATRRAIYEKQEENGDARPWRF